MFDPTLLHGSFMAMDDATEAQWILQYYDYATPGAATLCNSVIARCVEQNEYIPLKDNTSLMLFRSKGGTESTYTIVLPDKSIALVLFPKLITLKEFFSWMRISDRLLDSARSGEITAIRSS